MNKVIITLILILICLKGQSQNTKNSFSPEPGKKYIISGWVKEIHTEQQVTYTSSSIDISYLDINDNVINILPPLESSFVPSGKIIEGWQRIIGIFQVSTNANYILIKLSSNDTNVVCYFDDIRVFPYNGTIKSFVYDEETQRLMSELDENNYATFYEYDLEGGLIRVKKETEQGVYTIQETRSGTVKNN